MQITRVTRPIVSVFIFDEIPLPLSRQEWRHSQLAVYRTRISRLDDYNVRPVDDVHFVSLI